MQNIQNKKFLVYFYKNNFKTRWHDYVFANDVDEAWEKAELSFGKGNIESVSLEPSPQKKTSRKSL